MVTLQLLYTSYNYGEQGSRTLNKTSFDLIDLELVFELRIFSLPKKLSSAEIGGFCQGIPLIFEKKEYALVAEGRLRKSKINFFKRDYRDAIKDFTHHQHRDDVLDKLPDTVDAFDRVIFIPFYQFVLYWRWIKLKKVLKSKIL